MARRADPRQPSFLDLLAPPEPTTAEANWAAQINALVAEGLPPGAPAPFTKILRARPHPVSYGGKPLSIHAEVVMFDGLVHEIMVGWCEGRQLHSRREAPGRDAVRAEPRHERA
ncbi:hypothetical protein ACUXK4_003082 [Methylorubrum extorquens]